MKDTAHCYWSTISIWYFPRLYPTWDEIIAFAMSTFRFIDVTTVEINVCTSERTIQREWRNDTEKEKIFFFSEIFGEKIKNRSRALFSADGALKRANVWGVLSEKLLNTVLEKNKWSNYSNQSFKLPAGSAGAKTLKDSTKKKHKKKTCVIKCSLMKRKVDC